jgi:hypothetical protein
VINSVLALGFDDSKINWSELTPIAIEHKKTATAEDINKAIDANISIVGVNVSSDIVLASGLIGQSSLLLLLNIRKLPQQKT